ncbi:MAG: DUF3301 domain-containing protein [Methylovulum sp.]|uniref:DUF3301 domain-containing protein n=1 Tax=Methylovulum sp. TaxID=1916980 RepID=UPI00262A3DF5|nr:DUF3301 domain-containing protein [Methylovulum sp.]MDD2723960.1 DUF3301 domain-containing protein [Methylovulum sp.]MDD5126377.1 DUF3301 domain-containing protein [Methylovulum sp.]
MIDHIFLIALLVLGFLYWYHGQKVKQIAYQATQAYCQSVDVQMLDDYIAGHGLWLKRDKTGKMRLQRTFAFEFSSTGEQRYNGKIIMLGQQVDAIVMEPYRVDFN